MSQAARRAGLYPLSGLSAREAERQALREELEDREAEHQAVLENNRRIAMTKFKTPYGDTVDKPEQMNSLRSRIDDLYASAAEVLDVVTEAARREAVIEQTSAIDTRRFPAGG